MLRDVPALLAAGVLLAALEVAYALLAGRALFLTDDERWRYVNAAATTLPVITVLFGVLLRALALDLGRVRLGALLAFLVGAKLAYELTLGRRVRNLALRPVLILFAAAALGVVVYCALRWVERRRAGGGLGWSRGLLALPPALGLLLLDHRVLARGYPAFHLGLELGACALVALGALSLRPLSRRWPGGVAIAVAVGLLALAPSRLRALRAHPNASYVAERVAPWTGRLLAASYPPSAPRSPSASAEPLRQSELRGRGIDLRDRDVLLITIDALRADQLRALGGSGNTPAIDALANDAVVFRRAYTPAPHTSYALSSLLTGKFIKQVLEMDGAALDHVTLPDLLRRYGYRTAAFYPPAIFFVDGGRFAGLAERHFGFEYLKEMYASATDRVGQLDTYLAAAEPSHPLFVWVHLFEPHEPYDPPPELARDDSPRGRYEGEVRAADVAVGKLVATFRRARPGATVIITGDHGEEFGEHGGHYHGTTLFDEQVRVPLVWSSPGSVSARVVDVPVELVDVATTLLSAAGIPRDARMLGDDLGPVLAGAAADSVARAFASVDNRHMATDGKLKLVCAASEERCQAFDLVADASESRNVLSEHVDEAQRLRASLDAFLAAIPRAEALAVADGVAWPAALARAKLGAPGVGPDVVPLLSDARPEVRRAALEALGHLDYRPAAPVVDRLRAADPDPAVQAEATVTSLLLGMREAAPACEALLTRRDDGLGLARRAALALARERNVAAVPVLLAWANDGNAQEEQRLAAVEALGRIGDTRSARLLVPLLSDVRLRMKVAEALGQSGGKAAADGLAKTLANERYQPARTAEARALVTLKDKRVRALIERFLGMETGLPGGIALLMELATSGAKSPALTLATDAAREGEWSCDAQMCAPVRDASLVLLPRGPGPWRVTLLVRGQVGEAFELAGESMRLAAAEEQRSLLLPAGKRPVRLAFGASPVRLVAFSVVRATPEIPPPAPEPWEPAPESETVPESEPAPLAEPTLP